MRRRDLSKLIVGSAAGVTGVALLAPRAQALTCSPPACFPSIPAEVGVTIYQSQYQPFDIRRYYNPAPPPIAYDAALTAALAACGSTGGTIRCPAGTYSFASPINLTGKTSIVFEGDAGTTGGGAAATLFQYTGSAISVWITMNGAIGCSFRNIQLANASGNVVSTYIQCNETTNDPSFNGLFDCTIGASQDAMALHLDLKNCIQFTCERCNFIYGNPSVKGRQSSGDHSNVIRFRDCQWAFSARAPIQGGGEAWLFEGCNFEGVLSGGLTLPGAVTTSSSTGFNGLAITGCWFDDVSTNASAGSWLDIYGQGLSFTGNFVSGNANTTAITWRAFAGACITGNQISTGLYGINFATSPCQDIVVQSNAFNGLSSGNRFVNKLNVLAGTLESEPNYPSPNNGSPGSIVTNGYLFEPSGLVRMWGLASAVQGTNPYNFPAMFPTGCLNIVCTLSGVHNLTATIYPQSVSQTGFTVFLEDSGTAGDTFFWQAIGY